MFGDLVNDELLAIILLALSLFWLQHQIYRTKLKLARKIAADHADRLQTMSLLNSIVDQSTEIIFAKDIEGRYTFCNQQGLRALGLMKTEVLGKTLHELQPGESALRTYAIEKEVMNGNEPIAREETCNSATGTRTFLVSRKPLHDAIGRVTGVFGIANDVTTLELARTSQALLAAIVESSADAIICQDLDGLITSVNHAAEKLFGFSAAEAIGHKGAALSPGPRRDDMRARVIAGEVVRIQHTTRRHRDGQEIQVSVTNSPVRDRTGRVIAISSLVRDIGERVAMERELRERGDALERAQAVARLGHVVSVGGRIESYSRNLPQLLSRTDADLSSSAGSWLEWVCPDERPALRKRIAEAGLSGTGATFEGRMQRGDGAWIDIRYVAVPLGAEGDHPPRWFGTLQDVTEQKALEASLRESARFVEAVGDSMLSQMAVLDRDGIIISVNASWRRYAEEQSFEFNKTDLRHRDGVGADYLEVCRTAAAAVPAAAAVGAGIAAVLRGELTAFTHEYECDYPSEQRWFVLTASPLRIDGGGAVVIHTDTTERKRAEIELERHRERLEEVVAERSAELVRANATLTDTENFLRTLADQLPGCVAYWSRQGVCQFGNKSYCEWLGKSPAELLGRTLQEVFGNEFLAARAAHIAAVLDGESRNFEREEVGPDGKLILWWVHYIPDLVGTEVRGFIVLANNITEVKQAEVSLRSANQELLEARIIAEAATVAKSAFLANMSHEIRTPMNAIIGLTHLMRRDVEDPIQRDRLGKVTDAAQHLLGVIDDILDLSKIESGKLKLDNADFSTEALFSRVCALVAEPARAKGIELVIDTDRLPLSMNGDTVRLSQALLNYLSNAVKFTHAGSIRLKAEWLDRKSEGGHVRFEVYDTGIGIAPERLNVIFNPFEQADASTTRRFGGTGLGLSITRQLAQLMGGDAGATSELGIGSCFWFTARLSAAAPDVTVERGLPLAGLRVLLVDDLSEAHDALTQMLRSFGLRTDVANSGIRALEMAAAAANDGAPYDLHVIDWKVPGLDGVQIVDRLRLAADARRFRALIVATSDDPGLREAARAAGAKVLLVRPVCPSALHEALSSVMAKSEKSMLPATSEITGSSFDALRVSYAGSRILLAEDNPVNRDIAVELLRSANLEVDVAIDGAEAIALGRSGGYDLVLMDMQMPRVDGLGAARALRAADATRNVPIVAMTANAFSEDRQACLDAGMNDHVAKPVDPETLYAALARWLPDPRIDPCRTEFAGCQWPAEQPLAVATPADIFGRLADTGDIDVAGGLQLFGGQREFYLRILRRFIEGYGKSLSTLEDPYAAHDRAALAEFSHSLRGASSSICATRVEALAADVERLSNGGAPAEALSAAVELLHQSLRSTLGRLESAINIPYLVTR